MPPSLQPDDFYVLGSVAVWFGFFTDEQEADDYLNVSRDFERDFGFHTGEHNGSELGVTEQFVSVRELVTGFSYSEGFAEAVVAAAAGAGVQTASTMLIFFGMEFDPARVTINPLAPLTFLGNFAWSIPPSA